MKKIKTTLVLILMAVTIHAQSVYKGDLNNDGILTITDVMTLVNWILCGVPTQQIDSVCPDDNHPHTIDLALPSGTLWSCCNIDATAPEMYGGYYSWGETEGKLKYDWSTYIHCDGTSSTCHDLNGEICGTPYDVAREKWAGMWMMPTTMQQKELIDNCAYEWTTLNGVGGVLFTGTNGEKIFIPAGGYQSESGVTNVGIEGTYWSSQIPKGQGNASILYFKSDYVSSGIVSERYRGLNVRPVVTPHPLLPSTYYLSLFINGQGVVDIISGYGSYSVESSDEEVATAIVDSTSIVVKAVGGGKADITVTDNLSEQRITVEVTVKSLPVFASCPDDNHPHAIDMGLPSGTVWACCNVDAASPEEIGGYYAWGETEVKEIYSEGTYLYRDFVNGTCSNIGDNICGTEYDVAHMKWDGYWQMPSRAQMYEMVRNCTYSPYLGTFTSKINGNEIYMPRTGYYMDSTLKDRSGGGYYWTGTLCYTQNGINVNNAFLLGFGSSDANGYNLVMYRTYGVPIRPVAK